MHGFVLSRTSGVDFFCSVAVVFVVIRAGTGCMAIQAFAGRSAARQRLLGGPRLKSQKETVMQDDENYSWPYS